MSTPTRHCHRCGWEWTIASSPGRGDACPQCREDLRVCLNCLSYDPRSAQQCRDRRADPVAEKHVANFCEYFDFRKHPWAPSTMTNSREQAVRDQLRKLLGD